MFGEAVRDVHRRDRDAEVTRKAILNAAERLFSERGFAGTSMRDISEASGVSQPLIHHHFGSKKTLYQEIKRRAIERFWELWIERTASSDKGQEMSPREFLCASIEAFFWFVRDNEPIMRLSMWACLEGDTELWPGEQESIEILAQEIAKAQQAEILDKQVSPYMFTIMVEAVTIFWWQYRSNFVRLFSRMGGEEKIGHTSLDNLDRMYLSNVLRMFGGCGK